MSQSAHTHPGPGYYAIFFALVAFTLVTVGVSYVTAWGPKTGFIIAMAIASVKATLVVLYFMHVKFEIKPIYIVIGVPLLLSVVLVGGLTPDISQKMEHQVIAMTPETAHGEGSGIASAPPAQTPFPREQASASITGKVNLQGALSSKHYRLQGDLFCEHAHDKTPQQESSLVNPDNTLPNVFVYVSRGADQWSYSAPADPVRIDQKGCIYEPHVFGILVGQPLEVASNDDTTHNVKYVGKKNKSFNFTQRKGQADRVTFQRAETMGESYLRCDVHSWMRSYVGICYHPFFRVTGSSGTFDLGKLPPGEYEITAWHETLGTRTQTVTLAAGQIQEIAFTFSGE
jgi:caa(3)-type oxidase subunit IV